MPVELFPGYLLVFSGEEQEKVREVAIISGTRSHFNFLNLNGDFRVIDNMNE